MQRTLLNRTKFNQESQKVRGKSPRPLFTKDSVTLVGFGTIGVKDVDTCEGRNPATGGTVTFPAHKSPCFKAGKALKDR